MAQVAKAMEEIVKYMTWKGNSDGYSAHVVRKGINAGTAFYAMNKMKKSGRVHNDDKGKIVLKKYMHIQDTEGEDLIWSNPNFLVSFEEGEIVEVNDEKRSTWYNRIYLSTLKKSNYPYLCVAHGCEKIYENGHLFDVTGWKKIRKAEPKEIRDAKTVLEKAGYSVEKNNPIN